MFNSYHQLELRRKNIWHEGCHKTLANFKSVAYVHNRCRSEYNYSNNNFLGNISQFFGLLGILSIIIGTGSDCQSNSNRLCYSVT